MNTGKISIWKVLKEGKEEQSACWHIELVYTNPCFSFLCTFQAVCWRKALVSLPRVHQSTRLLIDAFSMGWNEKRAPVQRIWWWIIFCSISVCCFSGFIISLGIHLCTSLFSCLSFNTFSFSRSALSFHCSLAASEHFSSSMNMSSLECLFHFLICISLAAAVKVCLSRLLQLRMLIKKTRSLLDLQH